MAPSTDANNQPNHQTQKQKASIGKMTELWKHCSPPIAMPLDTHSLLIGCRTVCGPLPEPSASTRPLPMFDPIQPKVTQAAPKHKQKGRKSPPNQRQICNA